MNRRPDELLTVAGAATEYKCSPSLLYRLIREGVLEHRRLGRRVLLERAVLDEYSKREAEGQLGGEQDP